MRLNLFRGTIFQTQSGGRCPARQAIERARGALARGELEVARTEQQKNQHCDRIEVDLARTAQRAAEAAAAALAHPADTELAILRDWLASFVVFVRLFDRAVGLVPKLDPRELERSLELLGRVPDTTILRLFDLLGKLDDDDVLELVETLSRLSPTAARRATKLMSGVIRTVAR